jgi:putative FmdB family regulatory protein
MPLYEYRCANGHTAEMMRPMGEARAGTCEICGADSQRIFTPPNVHTQFRFSASVTAHGRPRHRDRR